VLSDTVPEMR